MEQLTNIVVSPGELEAITRLLERLAQESSASHVLSMPPPGIIVL